MGASTVVDYPRFGRGIRQIMKYLGTSALAIYGPIVNVSTFVQCCAYSVGQASQPIISINFGARYGQRIKDVLRYALYTVAVFSVFWTALSLICPNLYIYIFMKPTTEILEMAPAIIRCYGLSFILLPLNIFSTYYFQALMKPKAAFIVSVARGFIISGILIMVLPAVAGADSIWLAMPRGRGGPCGRPPRQVQAGGYGGISRTWSSRSHGR